MAIAMFTAVMFVTLIHASVSRAGSSSADIASSSARDSTFVPIAFPPLQVDSRQPVGRLLLVDPDGLARSGPRCRVDRADVLCERHVGRGDARPVGVEEAERLA